MSLVYDSFWGSTDSEYIEHYKYGNNADFYTLVEKKIVMMMMFDEKPRQTVLWHALKCYMFSRHTNTRNSRGTSRKPSGEKGAQLMEYCSRPLHSVTKITADKESPYCRTAEGKCFCMLFGCKILF